VKQKSKVEIPDAQLIAMGRYIVVYNKDLNTAI
jgi:hypothetical protein